MAHWQTFKRKIVLDRALVMGILNVTPDSFSDGGKFLSLDDALARAEQMVSDGASIIDIGGESTRPGSEPVTVDEEISRVVPIVTAVARLFDTPISVDTTKYEVAKQALNAGAEIVNDISGLRFDERIAGLAAVSGAGLILMHSRGTFETFHSQSPVDDIFVDVKLDFERAIDVANRSGVKTAQIALDIGLGFGKTVEQNFELIANLDRLVNVFPLYPMIVGASRKSFISKTLDNAPVEHRLSGSLAAAAAAIWNGAKIVRVHDVRETVELLKVTESIIARRESK